VYTTEPWLKQYLKDIILSRPIWWLIMRGGEGGEAAIHFYKYSFEPREIYRHRIPDGKSIINAKLKMGDSLVLLSDEFRHGCCLSC
jgi:uncharacterized glyoxalase superfamily protein PhnB